MSQNENIVWHTQTVSRDQKQQHKGHKPALLWYTGLSGSGKSTVANAVEAKLFSLGCHTYLLDGDNVRMGLNKGLTCLWTQDLLCLLRLFRHLKLIALRLEV